MRLRAVPLFCYTLPMATAEKPDQEEKKNESGRPRPVSRRRRLFKVAIALLVFLVLCLTFPRHWGPSVVSWAVSRFVPMGDRSANSFTIKEVSLSRLEVEDIRLGGLPTAPSCRSLSARYTLVGLLFSEIESLHLKGVSIHPGTLAEGEKDLALPSKQGAPRFEVDPPRPVDLLHGFSICNLLVEDLTADCSAVLPPVARAAFPDRKLKARIEGRSDGTERQTFQGKLTGTLFGGPVDGVLDYLPYYSSPNATATLTGTMSLRPRLADSIPPFPGPVRVHGEAFFMEGKGLEVDFSGGATCSNTVWAVDASGHYDACGYRGTLSLPRSVVTQDDGLVQSALALAPPAALGPLASLEFQATLAATTTVSAVTGRLPEWEIHGRVSDCSLSTYLGEKPAGVTGLVARAACYGVGSRLSPMPVEISVTNAAIGPFPFGRGRFRIIADKRMLLMTTASLGFCGGKIRAYSVYLTFDNLRSGFTLFLDQIAVNRLVKLFPGVGGSGRGRLYGQLPLRINADHELRLRNAFLYARPGETGNVSFENTAPIVAKLLDYGIQSDYCETIGFALRNLDYDLLRFDLTRPRKEDGQLSIRLEGQAMDGKKPTPVTLNVNLNGPIEKLLNLGIKTATITR